MSLLPFLLVTSAGARHRAPGPRDRAARDRKRASACLVLGARRPRWPSGPARPGRRRDRCRHDRLPAPVPRARLPRRAAPGRRRRGGRQSRRDASGRDARDPRRRRPWRWPSPTRGSRCWPRPPAAVFGALVMHRSDRGPGRGDGRDPRPAGDVDRRHDGDRRDRVDRPRPVSDLAAQPVVFGLAYLAFALAVAIRFGAIPFHAWAARLTDAVPETTLPLVTAWAPARLRHRRPGLGRCVDRPAARRPRRRPGWSSSAIAIASIVLASARGLDPGRPRARRRLLDHRRRRGGDARGRRARSGGVGAGPDVDPGVRRRPQRVRGVGRGHAGRRSSPAGSPTCAAGRSGRRSSRRRSGAGRGRSIGLPGLAAFDARGDARRAWPSTGPSPSSSWLGVLAPLAYYGRLLLVGVGRPDPGAAASPWSAGGRSSRRST